jgi:hypothetical protein
MHVKTDLLNSVGNVRPSEGKILQGAGETAEVSGLRIPQECASGSRQLGISVDRSRGRLAIGHACPVQNIQHVLVLGEEKTIMPALYVHTQEVVELSKVLHGKLLLQS